jgi:hypothetical protein
MSDEEHVHGEDDVTCWNCRQPFPNRLSTVVRKHEVTPEGKSEVRTFHDPDCAVEWESRGGAPRP